MHIRIALFIVYMTISLPLAILYIIELILLLIRPDFSSSFYTLFIFMGVADVSFFFMNILFYVLPFQPFCSPFFASFVVISYEDKWKVDYALLFSIANTTMYFLPTVQDVANVLVAVNRFLALLFPFIFKNFFTRRLTLILISCSILFSFSSCFVTISAPGAFLDITPDANVSEKIYMLHADSNLYFPNINRSTLVTAHTFACSTLSFTIYAIIAVQIFRSKIDVANTSEVRMLLLGFLIFLTNIPSMIYQIYWAILNSEGSEKVFMCLPWIVLIKTLSPPLFMLITNEVMRKHLRFASSATSVRRM